MSELARSATQAELTGWRRWYRLLIERRDTSLLITILVMVLGITRITPHFLTMMNMRTLGLAVASNGIVVIGMTILMIGGGIDLSIGSLYGLASIIVGMLISEGFPVLPGIAVGLLIGLAAGALHAVLINRFILSPFLATLGTMTVFRGLIWVISGGHSVVGLPPAFLVLGQTKIFGIQLPVYIMLAFVIVADFLLRRSTFLRQMFYIGINRDSAVAAGIPVARVTSFAYVLSALLAAFAGMLDAARLGAVYIQAGTGLEFQVITAAVVGGTALSGGKGSILGSLLGVIIMAMPTNVFNLVGVNMYWQMVLIGVILVAVVALDRLATPREVR
jgi:ribose transport system permease protein